MSFVIVYQVFHGKPFPVPASCSLPGRGNSLTHVSRHLCKATHCAVMLLTRGSVRGLQQAPLRSSRHLCISFWRIPFHSTHLFFKGKICFQAQPEERGLQKIRVTNRHTGNKLGSFSSITVPQPLLGSTQAGALRFHRPQLNKRPP